MLLPLLLSIYLFLLLLPHLYTLSTATCEFLRSRVGRVSVQYLARAMVLVRQDVPGWVRDENQKVIKAGTKKIPKRRVRAEEIKDNSMEICRSIGNGSMCDAAKEQMTFTLKSLVHVGAPLVLMQLVCLLYRANGVMAMDVDCVEYFAGCQAVTRAWSRCGYKSCPYEILLDKSTMDILSPTGFCIALTMALRLKRNAFVLLATVCSTWVFLSRSSTGRSIWRPLGNGSKTVEAANVMVSRMTLVLWLLQAKSIVWLYEQPTSSILWFHPRMTEFIRRQCAFRTHTYMGSFGAASPKGTVLWGSRPETKFLSRNLPTDREWSTDITKKSESGVSGGPGLKKSQAYTPEFGLATVEMWRQCCPCSSWDLTKDMIPDMWAHQSKKERWEDAKLTEVMQYLTFI